jgi:hypothetical protein
VYNQLLVYYRSVHSGRVYINAAAEWRGNIDEMLAVSQYVVPVAFIIRLSTIFRLSQMAEESADFRK